MMGGAAGDGVGTIMRSWAEPQRAGIYNLLWRSGLTYSGSFTVETCRLPNASGTTVSEHDEQNSSKED